MRRVTTIQKESRSGQGYLSHEDCESPQDGTYQRIFDAVRLAGLLRQSVDPDLEQLLSADSTVGSVNLIWPHDDGLIWPRESEVSRGGPGVGDRGPGRVDPTPDTQEGGTGAANPMTAPNTTPQIPSRDDPGTTMPAVCERRFTPGVFVHRLARAGCPGGMSGDTKLARV